MGGATNGRLNPTASQLALVNEARGGGFTKSLDFFLSGGGESELSDTCFLLRHNPCNPVPAAL
jgi:hypothetical protein